MGANEQGASATTGRWLTIPRTLSFVFNGDDVLLMKRAPDRRIFPNRYNGVGGHIERGEDPLTGAIREIKEETSLDAQDLRLRAVYNVDAGVEPGILLFVFTAFSEKRDFTGDGREGALRWVACSEVLALDLVEDLPYLWPRIWAMQDADSPLYVHVSYDDNDAIQMRFAGETPQ